MTGIADTVHKCADGGLVVPDNRWDLVDDAVAPRRTVSVVIPYYEQPEQLRLVLGALAGQTLGTDRFEVVVVDDGSARAPDVTDAARELDIVVVRQSDNGFRAAAARNLGARTARGEVLVFLDADTVPEPGYLEHAIRLPSLVPDAVVVGRRRHADLGGLTPADLADWWSGSRAAPPILDEPGWLVDAYGWTENLLHPGWTGYRYVISAVLTCTREIFDAAGGFDESFRRYGGEDWELANRMVMAGAVLAHVPDAIAWHDGADWAGRDAGRRVDDKNAEALSLAPLITEPAARSAGLFFDVPDVVVRLQTSGHSPASLHRTLASIVTQGDVAVWLDGPDADELHAGLGISDSRIRSGCPAGHVLGRSRFVLDVAGGVVLAGGALASLMERLGPDAAGAITVEVGHNARFDLATTRALSRARRRADGLGLTEPAALAALFGLLRLSAEDAGVDVIDDEPWLSW